MPVELLLCVATDIEGALLRDRLRGRNGIQIVQTGVGSVNAACAVTHQLALLRPDMIVACGIGGAYPESGLRVGDVACASTETYGDLGAMSPDGFLDMRALGFPIVTSPTTLYNDFPMQIFPTATRAGFVTVNTCTGTEATARSMATRTGGAVENMEGAAIAHVAHVHGVPVGEVRGISNLVADRDRSAWRIADAAAAAQEAVIAWIERL